MIGTSPGPRSEMVMLLLFSDTEILSLLLFRWPAGCSLEPLGFSIVYGSVTPTFLFACLKHTVDGG